MKLHIWKPDFTWCWECPVCHYGEPMPWREATTFDNAWADAESHLDLHLAVGQTLTWESVR